MSRNYYTTREEIRILGLTNSPAQEFAKLLLDRSTRPQREGIPAILYYSVSCSRTKKS